MRTRGGSVALALTIALTSVPAVGQEAALAPAAIAAQVQPPAVAVAEQTARPKRRHAKGDSLEGFNRAMFSVHQVLDRIFFRPVSMAYK